MGHTGALGMKQNGLAGDSELLGEHLHEGSGGVLVDK